MEHVHWIEEPNFLSPTIIIGRGYGINEILKYLRTTEVKVYKPEKVAIK